MIPLLRACAEEYNLHNAPFDEVIVRCSLDRLLRNETRDYENMFIIYEGDEPVGFLLASCTHSLYADTKVAHEDLWYVLPRVRGTKAAPMLFFVYETWALSRGATISLTGSNNERSSEKTGNVLAKLGYRQIGVTFVKEFNNAPR